MLNIRIEARRRNISVKELAARVLSGALDRAEVVGFAVQEELRLELKSCESGFCKRLFVRPIGSDERECNGCRQNNQAARSQQREIERQRKRPIIAARRKHRVLLQVAARKRASDALTVVLDLPN